MKTIRELAREAHDAVARDDGGWLDSDEEGDERFVLDVSWQSANVLACFAALVAVECGKIALASGDEGQYGYGWLMDADKNMRAAFPVPKSAE